VHQYGCLVLRGSKCILARKSDFACIPVTEPRAYESKQQAATRAIAQSCRVYSAEIALVHDVPAAVAYLPDVDGKGPIVLTVFLALAVEDGDVARGNGCGCDEPLDSEKVKLYDWYEFDEAVSLVKTPAERSCILSLTSNLATAVDAGVVILPSAFGPKIDAIDGDLGLHTILALTGLEGPKGMLCDSNKDKIARLVGSAPSKEKDSEGETESTAASSDKEARRVRSTPSKEKDSEDETESTAASSDKEAKEAQLPKETPAPPSAYRFCGKVSQEGASVTALLDFENEKRTKRMAKAAKGGGCCGGNCGPGCC